jgi:uncharacterized coiled-coil protein SlyX
VKKKPSRKSNNILKNIVLLSCIGSSSIYVIYGTWFLGDLIGELDARISVLEMKVNMQQQHLSAADAEQSKTQENIDERIEKIYSLITSIKGDRK